MEKKRDREQGGILGGVAELFDLPVDVVAGLPQMCIRDRLCFHEDAAGRSGL